MKVKLPTFWASASKTLPRQTAKLRRRRRTGLGARSSWARNTPTKFFEALPPTRITIYPSLLSKITIISQILWLLVSVLNMELSVPITVNKGWSRDGNSFLSNCSSPVSIKIGTDRSYTTTVPAWKAFSYAYMPRLYHCWGIGMVFCFDRLEENNMESVSMGSLIRNNTVDAHTGTRSRVQEKSIPKVQKRGDGRWVSSIMSNMFGRETSLLS